MSPARTRKVPDARQQARVALGRPADAESYDGLPPSRPGKAERPGVTWEPPDPDSMAVVLGFGEPGDVQCLQAGEELWTLKGDLYLAGTRLSALSD